MVTDDYIAAILQGDSILLQQMYKVNFPMIRRLIHQNGGTEDDARDVFQDAVMVIYEKARQPTFQLTSQFSAYLYGICRNLWLSRRQKKSSKEVTISDDAKYLSEETIDVDYAALDRRKIYDKAFARLGKDCQQLLLLYFQKITMEEIANHMGFGSESYARRRKFMCKERLTELVKSYPEYNELCNPQLKNEAQGKD